MVLHLKILFNLDINLSFSLVNFTRNYPLLSPKYVYNFLISNLSYHALFMVLQSKQNSF